MMGLNAFSKSVDQFSVSSQCAGNRTGTQKDRTGWGKKKRDSHKSYKPHRQTACPGPGMVYHQQPGQQFCLRGPRQS